jgi:hypothetical protein
MDRTNQPLTFGQPNQSLMNVQIILTDAGTEGVAQRPQFEVASIKANKNADAAQNARVLAGGRIEITNMPVRTLVRVAFGVTGPQVVGGPS